MSAYHWCRCKAKGRCRRIIGADADACDRVQKKNTVSAADGGLDGGWRPFATDQWSFATKDSRPSGASSPMTHYDNDGAAPSAPRMRRGRTLSSCRPQPCRRRLQQYATLGTGRATTSLLQAVDHTVAVPVIVCAQIISTSGSVTKAFFYWTVGEG